MPQTRGKWTFIYCTDDPSKPQASLKKEEYCETRIMVIRPETSSDRQSVFHVNTSAFPSNLEARIVNALRDAGFIVLSLVAEFHGRVVGNIVFSSMTIDGNVENFKCVGLGPVAIHPDFQKAGIGSALIHHGINICRERGYDVLAVLGSDYYSRFGFVPAEKVNIVPGDNEVPSDHFQALLLGDHMPSYSLRVKYAPQFFIH